MATGTTDPIRRATDAGWKDTLKGLTAPGSDPLGEGIYCQVYGGDACNTWYGPTGALSTSDTCAVGMDGQPSVAAALQNCTMLHSGEVLGDTCSDQYTNCDNCETACKEALITDLKEQILPASYFVFVLCFFLMIAVVWNNILIAGDGIEGISKILGLVINGIVVLFSFVLIILGGIAASSALDSCEAAGMSTDGCVPG